jgi:hypothetical protein
VPKRLPYHCRDTPLHHSVSPRLRGPFAATLAALLLTTGASPAAAAIVWQPNYRAADPIAAGWSAIEAPFPDRVRLQGNQLRVELRPGDTFTGPTGDVAHRAEVLGLLRDRLTASSQWPLCEGCERWTRQQLYVPPDWRIAPDGSTWLIAVQWKGRTGGSPPEAIEARRGNWELVACGTRFRLAAIAPGRSVRFDVGMFLSPDPSQGWIEAWVNGVRVVSRRSCATLRRYWDASAGVNKTDPIYLKNGIYRSYAWDALGVTHVLYYSAPLVTDARPF